MDGENHKQGEVAETSYPERIICDATMANVMCEGAYLSHARNHYSIFNMMEQFDGLLPHSPKYLEESGLSWISNVPYRAGWAKLETAATNRLNMLRNSIYFSSLYFRCFEDKDEKNPEYFFLVTPALKKNYEQRLLKIFIDTLHRDPCFLSDFLLKLAYNQVTWGYAVAHCEDYCVLPEIPEMLNVYFELANRKENIKVYIYVFIQRPSDLYRLYKEEEERGWDKSYYIKEGLEEALQWSLERVNQRSYQSWADIIKTYDATDLYGSFAKCTDDISWAWIFNAEVEGGVTKTLYRWNRGQVNTGEIPNLYVDTTMPNGKYLAYQRHYKNKKIQDMWQVFPNSGMTNTNVIQDMTGLGKYAYEFDISNNIKRNALNDALTVSLPLKLQPTYGQQTDQVNQINIVGGIMTLPSGTPPVREDGSGRNIQQALGLLQFEKLEYNEDTGQFNPQVAGKLTDRATDQQVQSISAEVSRQRSDSATVPFDALKGALLGILHRMLDDYKEGDPGYDTWKYFYNRVKNDLYSLTGQSRQEDPLFTEKEFFKAIVSSVDYISLDYTSNEVSSLQGLMQLAQTPDGKRFYGRKLAMANGASYTELEEFFPLSDSPDLNINDSSLSLIENQMFWETGEVAYNALQSPVTHLQNHFTKGMQLIGGIKEGMDPFRIWKWLSNMIPHAELHLQQLSQDPFEQENFQAFQATFRDIQSIAEEVAKVAQRQAQEIAAQQEQAEGQQQQGGLPPEVQAKINILEATAQEKMRRTQEQSQNKAKMMQERNQQQMQFAQERHQQQLKEQAERAALERLRMQQQQGE